PGAAYLEMAREAAVRGACLPGADSVVHIQNVMWAAPVVAAEAVVEIHTRLHLQDNGEIQYEIVSPGEGDEDVTVHSEGSLWVYTEEDTPVLNIEALLESCHQKELASEQCYEGFRTLGMEYGPAHQGIERIYVGQGRAIAKLRLPDVIADTEEQFDLHPALIDAALQATLGVRAASDPAKPALPFALEDLRVFRRCTREMWCFVRYSEGSRAGDKVEKLDIDLCDSEGKICVQMKGFSSRVMEGEQLGTAVLRPYWREQAADG
uniref:polyketide synthase dehydratase domain-containing protein n=1 Tax=Paenibacillus sp. GbtcB18 TaxID=2824763 RepID=UPI001C30EF66